MDSSSTDSLLREMARELRPVKRVPSLRASLALVLSAWSLVLVVFLTFSSLREDLTAALTTSPAYLSAAAGLLAVAIGGSLAALAAGVPGRERASRLGAGASSAGLLLGVLGCGAALVSRGLGHGSPMGADLSCFAHAAALAIFPALVLAFVLTRRWVVAPLWAGGLTLASAAAYAALVMQLTCPAWGPRHLVLGHLLVPVVLSVLGGLPLAQLLQRSAR